MLTRFVRIQLIIFAIVSIVGLLVMTFGYLQAPTLLGIGRMTITLALPESGGLYRFSNVTYRGVEVGKVTEVALTPKGATATLSIAASTRIPADLEADVLSVSAVGEQYVDLRPRTDSPPYLADGAVIVASNTTVPQPVGPMLDRLSALIGSIPKDRLSALLDESFKGFNGAGEDFGSLLDSSSRIGHDFNGVSDQMAALTDDLGPLLDGQAQTSDSIRTWARSLAGLTGQLAANDAQVRTILQKGPGFANEASRLLDQIKPTLPVLLANLTSVGQVGVTYHQSLEQVLVLFPPIVSSFVTIAPGNNSTGLPLGDFTASVGDPSPCTVGFLPPSSWRSPADTSTIDTPDGLYCKLPQDSPISVRGARNYPCIGHPGKRAPTVQICDSDRPFEPLALRQHVLGPYPIDPNLVAQGIPIDERVNPGENLYGPVSGTPLPPGAAPAGTAPVAPSPDVSPAIPPGPLPGGAAGAPDVVGVAPLPGPESGTGAPPPIDGTSAIPDVPSSSTDQVPAAEPSSFDGSGVGAGPSLVVAQYDPRDGEYTAPDGRRYRQSDLAASAPPRDWKSMLLS